MNVIVIYGVSGHLAAFSNSFKPFVVPQNWYLDPDAPISGLARLRKHADV